MAVERGLRVRETGAGVGGEDLGETGEGPGEGCFRLVCGLGSGSTRVFRVLGFWCCGGELLLLGGGCVSSQIWGVWVRIERGGGSVGSRRSGSVEKMATLGSSFWEDTS